MTPNPIAKAKRIVEDIDMMLHPDRWPDVILHLKTQPWIEPREFGFVSHAGSLRVYLKDRAGHVETFTTIEELAERWSVD